MLSFNQAFTSATILATLVNYIAAVDLLDQCPDGWIPTTDTQSEASYCYNCGLPEKALLGCDPHQCDDQGCSYYKFLCGQFSGHFIERASGPCSGEQGDDLIFKSAEYDNPRECHTGGDYHEMTAQAFSPSTSAPGRWVSDACGTLLNSCPSGLHDQAVIYMMNNGPSDLIFDKSQHSVIKDNDWSEYTYGAVKLTNLNKTCG